MFLANNREEFDAITAAIYGSSYQDELILQEYIPGDDNCMRVLNAYCGLDHKVKLMALGRPLLEEQTPEGIGNYAAILSDPEYNDAALLEKLKNFWKICSGKALPIWTSSTTPAPASTRCLR